MTILSLFDHTGNALRPWARDGHECLAVDLQNAGEVEHFGAGSIRYLQADVRMFAPPLDVEFCCAFPPCTHLAGSGARWWAAKGAQALEDALDLVHTCRRIMEATGAPWYLENPVGRLSTCWRKPDHYIQPWEYGGYLGGESDGYTKKTGLWTGGGFLLPEPRPIPLAADHDRIYRCAPGPNRANIRSATPQGWAQAVYETNGYWGENR